MKKTLCIKLFLLAFLLNSNTLYADDIWRDGFADEIGKGYWGGGSDMNGIIDWTLNSENCSFADESDYIKVVSTSGGRLEAKDCDGEAIWETISFNISTYSDVDISLYAAETGGSTNASKYIKCFYKLDGGPEIPFETNAENIGNWGNTTATQEGLNGSNLQVRVKMSNPNAGDVVYIKDVLISGTPILPESDKFTQILSSQNPIGSIDIPTTVNDSDVAVPFFRFKIDETAEAIDNLPTKISKMTFYNSNPDNGMNWETSIGGIVVFSDDLEVIPENIQLYSDSICIDFSEGVIDIPNGTSREFELRVFLDTINPLRDRESFQLYIKENAIGLQVFNSGSHFSLESPKLSSAVHEIDVRTSRIRFVNLKDTLIRNHEFSLTLMAVDEYDNLDFDEDEEVLLSLENGSGVFTTGNDLSKSFVKGEIQFDSLQYSEVETVNLSAKVEGLGEWISNDIVVENTTQTFIKVDSLYSKENNLSSLWIQEDNAFEALRFLATDSGQDNLPTKLEKIRLIGSERNQVNWKKSIERFIIKRNNEILDVLIDVDDSELTIHFLEEEIGSEIVSESTATYSIFCYLKEGKTIDGEVFQIAIDSLHSKWEISQAGSGLLPIFDTTLLGPEFTMNVEPESMVFSDVPDFVNFQEKFEVSIQLTDRLGNVDFDSNSEIQLSLATGNGTLSSENLNPVKKDGMCVWTDLVYSMAEIFTIQAECAYFPTILSNNISAVDRNSVISSVEPMEPIDLNPLAIDAKNAIDVFTFQISDLGTNDQLSTVLSSLKFRNGFPEDSFNWKKHIAGAVLKLSEEIIATTYDIEEEYIRFSSTNGLVEVANGLKKEFTLAIYFRKGNLPDHAAMQIEIPQTNHEWKTLVNGSAISDELPEKLISEVHQIEVKQSKYAFLSAPFAIADSEDKFSLRVGACDVHGNIDVDAKREMKLNLVQGSGELEFSNEIKEIANGLIEIDSIKYNGNDNFQIVIDSDVESDTVQIFLGNDELNIVDDFEFGNLNQWQNQEDWKASTYQPVNGNYSLKHNLSAEFGSSHISIPLSGLESNTGAIQWSFVIRNGDWDPSSGNRFVFHLLMNNVDPERSTERFSVGVNLHGSKDLLSLWTTKSDDNLQLLMESDFNWNEDESIAIQVKYFPVGRWEIAYNRLGEQDNWLKAGSVDSEVNQKANEWFSGLDFSFESSSRAGYLWFDDLKIQSVNTAPFLKFHKLIGQDSIKLIYSEDLDFEKSLSKENFVVKRNGESISSFNVHQGNVANEFMMKFNKDLLTGEYTFEVFNICDLNGGTREKEIFQLIYFAPAQEFDIVINEIMADESPAVSLPEHEYIELYNKLEYPVSVENWTLKINDKDLLLDSAIIGANSYLILCSNSAVDQFDSYGEVLGITGFSGLTNSEGIITIESSEAVLIDQIQYFSSWHSSVEKENGGYSLERMDPNNKAWQQNNWSSSIDVNGGTPGKLNSINSTNVDIVLPLLLVSDLVDEDCIRLVFSEPMDEIYIHDIANYKLSGDVTITKIEQLDLKTQEFHLFCSNNLSVNQQYELVISDKVKDLGGNSLEKKQYEFWVPDEIAEGDLIVNEVLFNPFPNGADYVEIINISEKIINLSQVKLGIRDENYQLRDTFSFSSELILPKEYLLITNDTLDVAKNYFTSNPDVFCQAKVLPSFSDKAGRVVISSNGLVIDDFEYNEDMHFELLSSFNGVALERVDPLAETNKETNWQSAAQNIGFGTPGLLNSVYKETNEESAEVSLSSKIFSPDNDGIDDSLMINFKLQEGGYLVSVRIYNSRGMEIRKLATNINLANEDALYWDGLGSRKMRAPIGVYLIYIELFNLEGEVSSFKMPCVLGGKFK